VSVTFPRGFQAAGITAGLKPSGRPDLALLVADQPCEAAGLFTTNAYPAAPVKLSRSRLAAGGKVKGVLVNSGDANAGRGTTGDRDALSTTAAAARALGVEPDQMLACSTGVIGGAFPAGKIEAALPELLGALSPDGGASFAESICTTDTVVKLAQAEVGDIRLGACAKGAAMVEPHLALATMLVFFATDAPTGSNDLGELARLALKPAFEELTIDGCKSTNDTVLLFASGAADAAPVQASSPRFDEMVDAARAMADSLTHQMAADAEGGTKVLLVDVRGGGSDAEAQIVAKAIANSVLVKTAIFGGDPNPGRFVQALGSSGVAFDPAGATIRLGDVVVFSGGAVSPGYDEGGAAHAVVSAPEITVSVDLGPGLGRARAVGCDLSYEYVRINAEYTT
jgi:glutamate N-acetyltransferase/amino-acid N-acetyltransferase